LAKQLRAVTQASARQCEKALALHGDDIDRAADWLFSQVRLLDDCSTRRLLY
jgi:translation elongation factor EF-Ts